MQVLLGFGYDLGYLVWHQIVPSLLQTTLPRSDPAAAPAPPVPTDPDATRCICSARRLGPSRRPTRVPLALRAATLGVIAAVLLGVLLFRLWALQVLHSDQYVAAAAAEQHADDHRCPRRGARSSTATANVLVSNTAAIAVQVDAARLPQGTNCGGRWPARSSGRGPSAAAAC